MPWKALKRLLELQGISLGADDYSKLHRKIMVKGDHETVHYKDALTYVQPNFDNPDPIAALWILRSKEQSMAD